MIVYLFNDIYFNKVNLPVKINGVYPLYLNDRVFLGNVEEVDGNWSLKLADNISYDNTTIPNITAYSSFKLLDTNNNNRVIYVYVLPSYDENLKRYEVKTDKFSIGKTGCDISYNIDSISDSVINFTYQENKWCLETEVDNVFVSDERVKKKSLFNGDFLFYYGLKIIFLDKFIIVNNVNNLSLAQDKFATKSFDNIPYFNGKLDIDEDIPLFSKDDYYFKSPRFNSVMEEEQVLIDEPPEPVVLNDTPMILTVGPRLTMLCTSVISLINYTTSYLEGTATKSSFITSVITISVMIVGALVWPALTSVFNKKSRKI